MIPNYYVAEYSIEQNCFHIEQLNDLLKINIEAALSKKHNDYQMIGIFETYDEASDYIEKVRPKIQGEEYAAKFKN